MQKREKLEIDYQPSKIAAGLTLGLLLVSGLIIINLHFNCLWKGVFIVIIGCFGGLAYISLGRSSVTELTYYDNLWYLRLGETPRKLAQVKYVGRLTANCWMLIVTSSEKQFNTQTLYLGSDKLNQAQFRALSRILLNPN